MFLQREINLGFMSMRHASLPERVAATAAAGFDGLSLRADQWQQMQDSGWGASRGLPQTQLAIEFLPPTDVPDAATAHG